MVLILTPFKNENKIGRNFSVIFLALEKGKNNN